MLLSDGWDHRARKRAVKRFELEPVEVETRHQMTFDTYEEGKLTEDEYWTTWSSFGTDHSVEASFGNSCLRNRRATLRC